MVICQTTNQQIKVKFLPPATKWITFLTQWSLVISFCANLLHSLIIWLIISSLLPHLLFCCVWSIFVAIRRDSVSLLRLPFLCRVYVFSSEISPVFLLKGPYNCFSFHFNFLVIFILVNTPKLKYVYKLYVSSFGCNLSSDSWIRDRHGIIF